MARTMHDPSTTTPATMAATLSLVRRADLALSRSVIVPGLSGPDYGDTRLVRQDVVCLWVGMSDLWRSVALLNPIALPYAK